MVLDNGFAGRVMAREGDDVRHAGNIFFINKTALPLGYILDEVIRGFSDECRFHVKFDIDR